MKKLLVVACLLMAALGAHAQFEQGKWMVNTSLSGLDFSYSKQSDARLGISGQAGYFFWDNIALVATVATDWSKGTDIYMAGGGGRYYFEQNGIYVGGGFKLKRISQGGVNTNDAALSAEAGYAYFLSRSVTIEPSVYYDLSFKDGDYSKFGIKVGFGFYF